MTDGVFEILYTVRTSFAQSFKLTKNELWLQASLLVSVSSDILYALHSVRRISLSMPLTQGIPFKDLC